jgi:hypothetical protein
MVADTARSVAADAERDGESGCHWCLSDGFCCYPTSLIARPQRALDPESLAVYIDD